MLLSKIDLMPHLRFDTKRAVENALAVNPGLKVLEVSGILPAIGHAAQWYDWLKAETALCARA